MAASAWLTCDQFIHRVGDEFAVVGTGLVLELTQAVESSEGGGPGPDEQTRNQFSLTFGGPAEPVLPQSTYVLSHAQLGELDIFLVPIAREGMRTLYEAAFA